MTTTMNATEKKNGHELVGFTPGTRFATVCQYTDAQVWEVVKQTAKTVTLKPCQQTLINHANSGEPDALVFHVGGFCANVTGHQRYRVTPGENDYRVTAYLRKDGRWYCKYGRVALDVVAPHYDYNF